MKIDISKLKQTCYRPIPNFKGIGKAYNTRDGIYIYKQNKNAKILGVAHLDSVLGANHFFHLKIHGDDIIINPCLDDRLGVFTLLNLLPQLGIQFDVLLTEGEESGRSTARYFETSKEYNWMFSFDRRGDDVVSYDYEDKELNDRLKKVGFKPAVGTFSDICFLENLGVKGFNVGTGYHGEHTNMSYASLDTLKSQIEKFRKFYNMFKDIKMPHEESAWGSVYKWDDGDFNRRFYYNNYPKGRDPNLCSLCKTRNGLYYMGGSKDLICESCLQFAGECQACHSIVIDDELTDGICYKCWDKLEDSLIEYMPCEQCKRIKRSDELSNGYCLECDP